MARLPEGERQDRQERVFRMLKQHPWGLREVEIAQSLGWDRRTVNNYLRELAKDQRAYRDGREWLAD